MFFAFDKLKNDKVPPFVFINKINIRDVFMIQPCGALGFNAKTPDRVFVCPVAVGEHFDRDGSLQLSVGGSEYGSHPATADEFFQPKMAQRLSDKRRSNIVQLNGCRIRRRVGVRWRLRNHRRILHRVSVRRIGRLFARSRRLLPGIGSVRVSQRVWLGSARERRAYIRS